MTRNVSLDPKTNGVDANGVMLGGTRYGHNRGRPFLFHLLNHQPHIPSPNHFRPPSLQGLQESRVLAENPETGLCLLSSLDLIEQDGSDSQTNITDWC